VSKGWDRASLDFKVRPDKVVRDFSRQDLMVPTVVRGRLHLAVLCLLCGVMLSLLWVWTVLVEVTVLGADLGGWFYPIVGSSALVFAAALYAFSTWDFDRQARRALDD
jgi:hypothetical protein